MNQLHSSARTRVSDMNHVKKLNCWGAELSDISVIRWRSKLNCHLAHTNCLLSPTVNCHQLSTVTTCQLSPIVNCHQLSNVTN